MEGTITEFSMRILLLFLPGVICSYLVDSLTSHPPREAVFFIIRAFVFGFASYFLYWAFLHLGRSAGLSILPDHVSFLQALEKSSSQIDFHEIFFVCFFSLILAVLMTLESTYKLTPKFFGKLGITNNTGELDVWGYALNSPQVKWVTVRLPSEDLVYDGWIEAFSDDGKDAELLLRDVSVYRNSTGELLYQVGALYLAPDRRAISLEFRSVAATIVGSIPPSDHDATTTPSSQQGTDAGVCEEGGD